MNIDSIHKFRYSEYMKTISIIRNRGQLTIPDSIRKRVSWVNTMSAVSVTLVKPNEIVIQPHDTAVNWLDVWEGIRNARSISGGGDSLNAAEFLESDRRAR